jgi:hypothetical protein
MNEETPPPIPPQAPGLPPQPAVLVNMKPRWIGWVAASVLMPALPWLTMTEKNDSGTSVFVMTALALVLQLAASIAVAVGLSRRRALGVGGAIGLSIVFLLASVAIGSAIWFAVCVAKASMDFK